MGQGRSTTRQSLRRIITTTTALLLLALVASGCTSFNGGGHLRSANPFAPATEKATFGINGKCKAGQFKIAGAVVQGAGLFDGQFQYYDRAKKMQGVGVKFHGRIAADATNTRIVFVGLTCQEVEQFFAGGLAGVGVAEFRGIYRPQYSTLAKQTGTFTGHISDLGEPGVQAGDTLSISLQGGAFTGYTNAGPLQGGNLQVS